MTKVRDVWYWLVERTKGSKSSRRDGSLYRSLPPIPEPKVRDKPRYTIMVIGQSGTSRQLELTGFRLRVIAASAVGILAIVLVLFIGWGSFFPSGTKQVLKEFAISSKVPHESGKPKKQESSQTSQEARLAEDTTQSAVAAGVAQRGPEEEASGSLSDSTTLPSQSMGKTTTEAGSSGQGIVSSSVGVGETQLDPQKLPVIDLDAKRSAKPERVTSTGPDQAESAGLASRSAVINFNAQEVVASSDAQNGGTLSFRLVKDQPEIRFEGYLFVYVEMEDKSGENKIYVYPRQTRLGDGDLPFDYKDGESISFKYNSRVELPYGDTRPGATIAGVSILLYGDNGKIMFQRTFGRKEVLVANTKNNKAERPKSRTGEKRQAL